MAPRKRKAWLQAQLRERVGQPSPNRFRNLGDMRMLRLWTRHDWWIRVSRETLRECRKGSLPGRPCAHAQALGAGLDEKVGFGLSGEQGAHAQAVKRLPAAVESAYWRQRPSEMLVLMLVVATTFRFCPLVKAQPLCRWGCPSGPGVLPGVGDGADSSLGAN